MGESRRSEKRRGTCSNTAGQLLTSVTVLVSTDFDRTVEFYASFGFLEITRYPNRYLILRRDGAEIHFNFSPDIAPKTNFRMCYIRVLNVTALQAEWSKPGWPVEDAPRFVGFGAKDWGMIEAHSVDPDGNLVLFGAAQEDPPQ